ncbi:STAS domain-containing protein [Dactylosporangium sp. NPDC051541]|uniref:STAS domain-containing protein n=1 Tax=Dactylosporangium sp. NPDC051541 TaxID=3363977 RepID=UPI0037B078FC
MNSDQRSGSGLTITAAAGPGGVVLVASGALDYHSSEHFAAAVNQAFAGGAAELVADLSGLAYCDSSGVAALVRAHKQALREGRRFVVRNPDTTLSRVLALTGLDSVLTIEH